MKNLKRDMLGKRYKFNGAVVKITGLNLTTIFFDYQGGHRGFLSRASSCSMEIFLKDSKRVQGEF